MPKKVIAMATIPSWALKSRWNRQVIVSCHWFLTGSPECGKTTVLEATAARLEGAGWTVQGLLAPERRVSGERVGFDIVDRSGTHRQQMADITWDSGPPIGRYRVDPAAIEDASTQVLTQARSNADVVIIDELGPMQFTSETFIDEVEATLAMEIPTVATVKSADADRRLSTVTQSKPPEPIEVTPANRDTLPASLATEIDEWLR